MWPAVAAFAVSAVVAGTYLGAETFLDDRFSVGFGAAPLRGT
jgi:hypothetical protein